METMRFRVRLRSDAVIAAGEQEGGANQDVGRRVCAAVERLPPLS
jgi:hypothetical protein